MAGIYDDAEFDAEIIRTQSSDWSFVATRVVTLAIMFFFLARAIGRGASAAFLLLPLAVEFVSIMWLGLILGYCFVDCPRFIESGRRPGRVVFWTLALFGAISVVLGWENGGGFDSARIGPGWLSAWHEVWRTGLIWAMAVEVLGLLVSTAREVVRWRRVRGVFIWMSVFAPSLRIAVVIVLGVLSPFVLIPLGDSLVPWLVETPRRIAWTAFGFLMFVEFGGLALGVVMHRGLNAEAAQSGSLSKRKREA
jgi:hypothetical protein